MRGGKAQVAMTATKNACTKPCGTCPYRRSTPLGVWDKAEYDNLRDQDRREFGGSTFGCHLGDDTYCRGWLADQKKRGVPSIMLRLLLMTNKNGIGELFESVDKNDPDLYNSISEMCEANEGRAFPRRSKKAQKLAAMKRRPSASAVARELLRDTGEQIVKK